MGWTVPAGIECAWVRLSAPRSQRPSVVRGRGRARRPGAHRAPLARQAVFRCARRRSPPSLPSKPAPIACHWARRLRDLGRAARLLPTALRRAVHPALRDRCPRRPVPSRWLTTIPFVGPMFAHATRAAIGEDQQSKSARDSAVSPGPTPRIRASGQTRRMGGISEAGDQRHRRLSVPGATAAPAKARAGRGTRGRDTPPCPRVRTREATRRIASRSAPPRCTPMMPCLDMTGITPRGATAGRAGPGRAAAPSSPWR
jgi:transposase